jgi:hypothetical protein
VHGGSAGRRDGLAKLLQRLQAARTDKQARPFPREGDRSCSADSGARPGNKYGLSLKSSHNFLYPKKRKAARCGLRLSMELENVIEEL